MIDGVGVGVAVVVAAVLVLGQQGVEYLGLLLVVLGQEALKAVENGAAQVKRLLLVDHRHEQDDDDRPLRRRRHHHVREELLILLVAAYHLTHRVDRLYSFTYFIH